MGNKLLVKRLPPRLSGQAAAAGFQFGVGFIAQFQDQQVCIAGQVGEQAGLQFGVSFGGSAEVVSPKPQGFFACAELEVEGVAFDEHELRFWPLPVIVSSRYLTSSWHYPLAHAKYLNLIFTNPT